MKIRLFFIWVLALAFTASVGFRVYTWGLQAYRGAMTGNTMGFIQVAMDKTLNYDNADHWDAFTETVPLFPEIPVKNHEVLDGWGNPLHIIINRVAGTGHWQIISAGPDGTFGTEDDLTALGEFHGQANDPPPVK